MVFFVNEKQARKLFKLVGKDNVAVFTYVGSHKAPVDKKVKMDYSYAGYAVPQKDVISAVIAGNKTIDEVVSSMVKILRNPNPKKLNEGEINTVVSLTTAANMASSQRNGKSRVMIFLKEEPVGDTAENTKLANKLIKKWLTKAFNEFGMSVLTDIKEFKGSLNKFIKNNRSNKKSKKKKSAKKEKKQLTKTFVVDSDTTDNLVHVENSGTSVAYIDALQQLFHLEISYSSIYQDSIAASNFKAVGVKKSKGIINNLFAIMAGTDKGKYDVLIADQIPTASGYSDKKQKKAKKNIKKAKKQIRRIQEIARKNVKDIIKAYKSFGKVMSLTNDAVKSRAAKTNTSAPKIKKIPKIKFGGKKSAKAVKKASKFFQERKNTYLLAALIAHCSTMRMGNEFGSKPYVKSVSEMLGKKDSAIAKGFETAVAALNAELKKTTNQ